MLYECDQCNHLLPPAVTACPYCGDKFDSPVPADAEIPTGSFAEETIVSSDEPVADEPAALPAAERRLAFEPKLVVGLIGAVALFVGVFAPVVGIPVIGSVSYIQNSDFDGIIMTALAVISVGIVLFRRYQGLWYTGASALGVLSFTYLNFEATIAGATNAMSTELAHNPFSKIDQKMIQTIHIQWGFAVLVIAAILLISAAAIPEAHYNRDPLIRKPKVIAPIVSAALFLIIVGLTFAYTQHEQSVAANHARAKTTAALREQVAEQAWGQATQKANQAARDRAIHKLTLDKGEWGISPESNEFATYVVGRVRNDSDRTFGYLQVQFDLVDGQGNKIGSADDVIADLKPGQTWKFKAMGTAHGVARAHFAGFKGIAE